VDLALGRGVFEIFVLYGDCDCAVNEEDGFQAKLRPEAVREPNIFI
jgi:hypothetical protein